jgi:hypothetical protein
MHKLYLEKYEIDVYNKMQNDEETKPIVKYDFFCRFFADNFNIRFGYPRTNTCQTCDRLKNVIDVETNEESKMLLETEKQVHVSKAEFFYQNLKKYEKESKINNTTEVLCFDYQQNLPLPHVPAGDVFYKRQLWVYNFCIYSGKTGKSYFYMYDEAVAKKGKNEVISFLKHFLARYIIRDIQHFELVSRLC